MKKVLSILLVAIMLFTMVPAGVFAADGTSVKLVSFMRGDVTDLRSSELLEVQVEGYEGNPRELTYKWTSSLGTYLYIYNSHNMYGINNTYGEYEIYNTDKNVKRNSNVEEDRSGDKTLSKVGFMWASVYGAYTYNGGSASTALKGTVKVEVFDKNGTSLGSDSFSGFKVHNLDSDLDNVVIGLFEGDRKNALDLLGESGIVHITCDESKVSSADILSGDDHIAIETEEKDKNTFNYFIKGVKAGEGSTNGDAQLEINIKKTSCKFHYNTSGSANPIVYVFKKPTTSTTTTTLTLDKDSLDGRCEYFIDGNKGEEHPDGSIVFTGLTPNTEYTVEVRAEYKDSKGNTKYVYGYVDDTTKPVYKATVKTYLDDKLTDIADIHGEDVTLYLHEDKEGAEYIALKNEGTGVYTAEVTNGVYFPWHIEADDHYHKAKEFKLIIENANGELNLHHYSVTYDANDGAFADGGDTLKEIYPSASAVSATDSIPVREGYIFTGWEYNGKTYNNGDEIVSRLSAPITLTAKWEKQVNVTINVTIDHNSKVDSGFDPNESRTELDVDFVEMKAGTEAFVETGDKLHFRKDKTTDEKGNEKAYTYSLDNNVSTYTATDYTYTGLLESSTFGVALHKSGYDVGAIEKKQDKLGNWVINIPLTYNPDDFDLDFSIEMADDVPTELYPDAVIVKVAYWNTETNEWKIISQQETVGPVVKPGVRVDINPTTGEGSGSYPVWRFDGSNNPYGYRAVVTGFIYKGSTIVIPTEKDHTKENGLVEVTYTDGNYTATMGDVIDGKRYSTSLNGAYYDSVSNAQAGTLDGVITVEKYDVTFDAKGGTVNGKDKDVAKEQYYIPELDAYKPTMEDHNFLGWYTEDGEKATEGELLTEDITLYAKWDKTLTGTLIVDGYYTDESGTQHKVDDVDRATHALVELEEIFDGHTYDIAGQTVEIEWPKGEHTSEAAAYEFKGLDPEKTYRISVYLMNYEALYQNSTTVINGNGDIHDDYTEHDFTAVYPEEKLTTFVNTFLHFEPEEYVQNVIVDSSLIGEGFRPTDALVKYYSEEIGVDDEYVLITQHKGDDEGVKVKMNADGKTDGEYGDKVWKKNYNGNLYDYQASLSTIDGKAVSEWPVSVVYGEPSRYSPLNGAPTGVLQVKLVPNRYGITYNENYEDEGVNIVSYVTHIWSYETAIDYSPVRDGYVFEGWYSNPECTGEKVTAIAETVAQDTELYAKWKKRTDLGLKVNYVDKDSNELLETETKTSLTYGEVITSESLKKDFKGYSYISASADSITIGTEINEITLYYVKNNYNYTVNYFLYGTTDPVAESKNVADVLYGKTVTETAPEIKGYTINGDKVKSIVIDTENNVINFYYSTASYTYTVNYLEEGTNKVLKTAKKATVTYGTSVTESYVAIDDYVLVSDEKVNLVIDEAGKSVTFYYALDTVGRETNPNNSDSIPDKYQKEIVFKVVNGTWENGKSTDIVKYVTLKTDGKYDINGTASLTAPTGMTANAGYEGGAWDVTPPVVVSGTDKEIYTYEFVKIPVPENPDDSGNTDTPDVPGGEGDGDGSVSGGAHHIVFGKTDGIGWYNVSKDGGKTWDLVFGNSTYEVENGTELIIKAGDIMGDSFTFYVNGDAVKPNDDGELRVTVKGYMLIGAIGIDPDIDFEVPDVEESLNWFQKIIKAIKDFFAMIGSWFK